MTVDVASAKYDKPNLGPDEDTEKLGSEADPFPPFDEDDAFKDLRTLIQGSRPPIALIGAGASVKSGYPTWPELLEQLRHAAGRRARTALWKRNLDDINDAPWTAEIFSRELAKNELSKLIKRLFGSRGQISDPHLSLARMPFPHFLTTNYDPSIEEALDAAGRKHQVVKWCDAEGVSDFLINMGSAGAKPRVLYLHGRYDDAQEDIILTESSYVSRYVLSEDARRKLMAIFLTHPVLLVGFSMNDPDLANLMREVTARLKAKTPCHFAVMSYRNESDREATRARMEGKFGIRPVFFSRNGGSLPGNDYANMIPLLEALAGRGLSRGRSREVVRSPEFDPEDPHKGRFGSKFSLPGLLLSCRKIEGSRADNSLRLELLVEQTSPSKPLSGKVKFFLHPTFHPSSETVRAKEGRATIKIWSYGAFTVGVEIEDGTRLELDLARVTDLPLWFRRQ